MRLSYRRYDSGLREGWKKRYRSIISRESSLAASEARRVASRDLRVSPIALHRLRACERGKITRLRKVSTERVYGEARRRNRGILSVEVQFKSVEVRDASSSSESDSRV